MQVDIVSPPPPLEFGEGAGAFKLRLKRFNGDDRMGVFDACAENNYSQIQFAVAHLVIGWEGVHRPDGTPIPFDTRDEKGNVGSNFAAFMGAIPLWLQVQVLGAVLAFLGIPDRLMRNIVESLRETGGPELRTDPIEKPGGDGDSSASTG